jgi:pimeloyl-ACP methyl ester carboxylesterase
MVSAFDNLPSGTRHRIIAPDGVTLEVREWGDPGGPALLMIPGVAQSYLSFARQYAAPELQGLRIVSYDPRGHGLSDKPLGIEHYGGRRWSDDVAAVMSGLGLDRPILLGWSLGGRILRQYLVVYGDGAVSGVAFVSCRPVEIAEVVGPGNAILPTVDLTDEASRISVALQFLRNCFGKPPEAEDLAFMFGFNMLCPFEIRQQIGQWLTPVDVSEAALRAVTVPALVVHGRDDILVLPKAGEITASLIPQARTSWYEGCGHSVFFEEPARFNRELLEFVTSVTGARSAPVRAHG